MAHVTQFKPAAGDHVYEVAAPLAVKVTLPPPQMVSLPDELIVTVGVGLTTMVTEAVSEQPPALAPVTV